MGLLKFVGAEAGEVGELPWLQAGTSVVADAPPNSGGARIFKGDGTQTLNSGLVYGINSSAIYISCRFKTEYSGTPSASRAIRLGSCWTINAATQIAFFNVQHLTSGSNSWRVYLGNGPNNTLVGTPHTYTYTSGTWIDFVVYSENKNETQNSPCGCACCDHFSVCPERRQRRTCFAAADAPPW